MQQCPFEVLTPFVLCQSYAGYQLLMKCSQSEGHFMKFYIRSGHVGFIWKGVAPYNPLTIYINPDIFQATMTPDGFAERDCFIKSWNRLWQSTS